MKTSASQFVMMVTLMEEHGDLSKLSYNARGRLTSIQKWEELAQLLNSDGSGDSRTVEKWKKVWSDLKNNTKKKASRLHRAASGTGGGPAVIAKLTDLEHRILNLMGLQAATGVALEEAGLPQSIQTYRLNVEQAVSPQPPSTGSVSSPPMMFVEREVQSLQPSNEASTSFIAPVQTPAQERSSTQLVVEVQMEEAGVLSPTRPSSEVHVVRPEPALSGHTTPRRVRSTRLRGSPRSVVRPTHTEQASQLFLQTDTHWRNFKEQQHRDYVNLRREQNRIREMEVEAQREWQAIGRRVLDIIDKIVDKFCRE